MPKTKSKSTKRFNFEISRNDTSHQAGSNSVTISTNPSSDRYSTGISTMRMTVKEARALNLFLTKELTESPSNDMDFSDPNDITVPSDSITVS